MIKFLNTAAKRTAFLVLLVSTFTFFVSLITYFEQREQIVYIKKYYKVTRTSPQDKSNIVSTIVKSEVSQSCVYKNTKHVIRPLQDEQKALEEKWRPFFSSGIECLMIGSHKNLNPKCSKEYIEQKQLAKTRWDQLSNTINQITKSPPKNIIQECTSLYNEYTILIDTKIQTDLFDVIKRFEHQNGLLFWCSLFLIIVGVLGSLLYDCTVKHLLVWIKDGNRH